VPDWLGDVAQLGLPGLAWAIVYWATKFERDVNRETLEQLREDRDYWRDVALERHRPAGGANMPEEDKGDEKT